MNKQLIITITGLFFAVNVFAQTNKRTGDEDTLKNEMIIVVNYKPTIADAKKLVETPTVIDTVVAKPTVRYMFGNEQYTTTYTPETIKAAKMKGEPLDPLYRGYAKAGVGNGINYLADVHLNTLRSRNGALGFKLNSIGTQGNYSTIAQPAPYNHTNTSIYGKKFFKKHALDANVGYDRERVMYYGFDETNPYYSGIEPDLQDKVFKQVYNDWSTDLSLKSFYNDSSKLNHKIDLGYHFFSDLYMANIEHNVVGKGNMNTYFGTHLFDLDLLADFNSISYANPYTFQPYDSIPEVNNNFIAKIYPKFITQNDKWRVEVGLELQAEMSADGTTPYIYPRISGKYNLVKEIIIPYASFSGGFGRGVSRNNLNSLTGTNPFLWTNLTPLQNTKEVYNLKGGFRGAFTNRFTYNLYANLYKQENTPLFTNYNASQFNAGLSRFGENYFVVIYDTIATTEIGGELTYRIDEKLQIVGSGVFRSFNTTHEFEAWQKPSVEIHLSGFYQIRSKISLKGQLHFFGPRWSKSYDNTAERIGYQDQYVYGNLLPSIFDLSLGAEYRYTERLSGFINFNNLVAQKYQYWNQFPAQRFNVMFGATFSFWKE
jgi:hypothetical protein